MKASCDRYATVVSLSWVARPESTSLRGLAGCMARGLSPRIEVPASLWHERGNHQVVDRGFCWNLWNPECNFKYFSLPSTNVKLETKGLILWINSWEMNVAKSLLNRREEVRGIWWFCFFCDISNSYLSSVGQRQMTCQAVLRVVFSGCMDPERTGNCVALVCVHRLLPQAVSITSSEWEIRGRFTLPVDGIFAPVPRFPLPTEKVKHKLHVQKLCDGHPGWHRLYLWNCSSFLRLCKVWSACRRFPTVLLDRSDEQ